MAVVFWDWPAEAFLHADRAGRTSWRFLISLEESGVPATAADFLRNTTVTVAETLAQSNVLLRRGILSEYEELAEACASLQKQRATISNQFERTAPRHHRLLEQGARRASDEAAAREELARRIASDLKQFDHAVVDDFLTEAEARDDVGRLLRSMHSGGELQPGQVKGGLNETQRSDLMKHIPGAAEQPPALRKLLGALDRLLLALRRQEGMADLRAVPLVRAEVQCTCYPGDGSRYIKHTDDARQQTRKLTCILYANPEWAAGDGGELRLHLGGRAQAKAEAKAEVRVETLAPLGNRLVVFWSDARVPHEVLPTHKPRYAVTVWYSDARGVRVADAAAAPATVLDDDPTAARPFDVRQLPGRGWGLVARRPLALGERVLAERPLIHWRVATRDGVADMAVLDRLVSDLCAEERASFYELVDAHGPRLTFDRSGKIASRPEDEEEASGDGCAHKTSLGIYVSNSFQLERGDCFMPEEEEEEEGVVHAAVLVTSARLNHSCRPNCFAAWNPAIGQQTVHALRAIGADEELTIAYLGGAAWDLSDLI